MHMLPAFKSEGEGYMNVHKETIEALSALYNQGHRILDDEYDAEHEGEDAQEAAAIDYMTSKARHRFCSLFDNLKEEVQRELIALMQLGREPDTHSSNDFKDLVDNATTGPEAGDALFGMTRLPEYWNASFNRLSDHR